MIGEARKPAKSLDFSIATINIVFLLLLFFLVAGSLAKIDETRVVPPITTDIPADRLPRPLLIVEGTGELVLDGIPLDRAALEERIAAQTASGGPLYPVLNILADRDMNARQVLELADDLRARQAILVRIVTVKEE